MFMFRVWSLFRGKGLVQNKACYVQIFLILLLYEAHFFTAGYIVFGSSFPAVSAVKMCSGQSLIKPPHIT
jgi:hypothetical protein